MFASMLLGLAVNVLTFIAKKLNVSGTVMSIGLSIVGGTIYYLATKYYVVEWESFVGFLTGIYATSQVVFNLLKKFNLLDENGGFKIKK